MEFIEVSAKTIEDAITEACQKLSVTSEKLDYSVIQEPSSGFLGIKNGEQNEFVYTKVNNTYEKLSQLDWTMKDLFYSGAKINFLYKNFLPL